MKKHLELESFMRRFIAIADEHAAIVDEHIAIGVGYDLPDQGPYELVCLESLGDLEKFIHAQIDMFMSMKNHIDRIEDKELHRVFMDRIAMFKDPSNIN